ncbi:hypothetical protein CKM354_001035900 [Cercospora kikuchii]|uniref:Uncharacterized protein n=1 Tax=Cercospora kikuchii TaxID=84275 RepID=A0A9P3CQ28_9PEZI|nr:uncharacterized protein CKM354_001035900 [Cercospora kikuchii]GIZ47262.1 hypothetical protein CKM354_001035900 [Cercospora kikuchii]
MSGITNTQNPTAIARVFGTPELLEIILLEVACSDIEFTVDELDKNDRYHWDLKVPNCKVKHAHDQVPHFTWTPIILRAVNRDFRDTIDGSSKLLHLRLRAIPPQTLWEPESFRIGDKLGPLHWLERKLGYHAPDRSKIKGDVLELHLRVSGNHDDKRIKLHNDRQGSWRQISCLEEPHVVSTVVIHLYKIWSIPGRTLRGLPARAYYRRPLCSCDIGSRPTLGEIFDVIDAAESRYCSFPLIRKEGGSKCQC